MSMAAVRNSSRRRTPRAAVTACSPPLARPTAARISCSRWARLRGSSPPRPRPRRRAAPRPPGARISRSGASRPADSTRARFSAAAPSSLNSRRYQGVLPNASDTLRKLSSPASGSAESANHPSSTGSSVRWIAALRDTPEASASRCRKRRGRIGVPERDQPLPGRVGAQPGLAGGELGDGVEQRPVEELLVQPPYDGSVPLPLTVQLGDGIGAQAQRPPDAPQIGVLLGHEVGPPQPVELYAVLHGPQEPVRVVELHGVGAPHVAAGGQRLQRVQGGPAPQRRIGPPVHQLQQLHGEFDVPQPAGPELQLTLDLGDGDVLDHPAPHLLHVGDEVLALGGVPDEGRERGDVLLAELEVAGHRPRLEQGLELPGLGPPLVVREVAAERPHERPVPALGPQVRVDGPDDCPRRWSRSRSASDARQAGWRPGSPCPRRRRPPPPPRRSHRRRTRN